ncbi:MAG: hypothetical protein MTP17_00505 [Candidatus Midichloria sp.]|nr:MAG: hypothetical protein MTP17_00505 [Candidatus Midichloria sp.]
MSFKCRNDFSEDKLHTTFFRFIALSLIKTSGLLTLPNIYVANQNRVADITNSALPSYEVVMPAAFSMTDIA